LSERVLPGIILKTSMSGPQGEQTIGDDPVQCRNCNQLLIHNELILLIILATGECKIRSVIKATKYLTMPRQAIIVRRNNAALHKGDLQ